MHSLDDLAYHIQGFVEARYNKPNTMTVVRGKFKARILDSTAMQRALNRIAHQILERNPNTEDMVLIGIRTRGVPLCHRLAHIIRQIEGKNVAIAILDIKLYREDLTQVAEAPVVRETEIPFSVKGKTVILVDDVLYTGRTTHAALDALLSIGRPAAIQLAVLIDRGHRELPIHADYVGKNVPTGSDEIVDVRVKEIDNEDQVLILEKE
jgi:pyrimidine operon attenuation protein/uracil phosphoribosyltransferase